MAYEVTGKYVPPAGSIVPPGEHYSLIDEQATSRVFREANFYRTPRGREIATDRRGHPLAPDGDLAKQIREAIDAYDQEHS